MLACRAHAQLTFVFVNAHAHETRYALPIRGGELRTAPVLVKEVDTVDNPRGLFCTHRDPHTAEVSVTRRDEGLRVRDDWLKTTRHWRHLFVLIALYMYVAMCACDCARVCCAILTENTHTTCACLLAFL
jgi:hypothetical protein